MTTCLCTHAKSRHRQQYGEPHTGACRDCDCPALVLSMPALSVRQWDVLEAVSRCGAIGERSLARELAERDSCERLDGFELSRVLASLAERHLVHRRAAGTVTLTQAGAAVVAGGRRRHA